MDEKVQKTAVIVDDELLTRLDFTQMLGDLGISVVGEAGDGFDAVDICREKRPDLVLIDIRMPVFDGLGATDLIIRDDLAGSVIVVSAYDDEETIRQAVRSGVATYLVKPVERQTLFIAVETALAARRRIDQLREQVSRAESALQDMKLIDRAKAKLASEQIVSEAEAYRIIQKTAMDKQVPMRQIALHVLHAKGEDEVMQRAKEYLMETGSLSEKQAYRRIRAAAERKGVSVNDAAATILRGEE